MKLKIIFLGHVIDENRIKTDVKKLKQVRNLKDHDVQKECKVFLG